MQARRGAKLAGSHHTITEESYTMNGAWRSICSPSFPKSTRSGPSFQLADFAQVGQLSSARPTNRSRMHNAVRRQIRIVNWTGENRIRFIGDRPALAVIGKAEILFTQGFP